MEDFLVRMAPVLRPEEELEKVERINSEKNSIVVRL